MTFFGLKEGQDLENRAAQPHQAFLGVPPPPGTQLINPFHKMGKVKIHTQKRQIYFCIILTKDPHSRLVRRLLCRRFRVRFPNVTSNRCFDIYSFRVALNRFISVYS